VDGEPAGQTLIVDQFKQKGAQLTHVNLSKSLYLPMALLEDVAETFSTNLRHLNLSDCPSVSSFPSVLIRFFLASLSQYVLCLVAVHPLNYASGHRFNGGKSCSFRSQNTIFISPLLQVDHRRLMHCDRHLHRPHGA
jgi:hypothetical protein